MKTSFAITIDEYEELMGLNVGFCLKCGAEREMTEPDAECYDCPDCGHNEVYGLETLLVMGYVV